MAAGQRAEQGGRYPERDRPQRRRTGGRPYRVRAHDERDDHDEESLGAHDADDVACHGPPRDPDGAIRPAAAPAGVPEVRHRSGGAPSAEPGRPQPRHPVQRHSAQGGPVENGMRLQRCRARPPMCRAQRRGQRKEGEAQWPERDDPVREPQRRSVSGKPQIGSDAQSRGGSGGGAGVGSPHNQNDEFDEYQARSRRGDRLRQGPSAPLPDPIGKASRQSGRLHGGGHVSDQRPGGGSCWP